MTQSAERQSPVPSPEDDPYARGENRWFRRVGAVAAVAAFAGLIAVPVVLSQRDRTSTADRICPEQVVAATVNDSPARNVLLLVDQPSNDKTQADQIARDLVGRLRPLLADGVRAFFIIDPGGQAPLITDPCLDGSRSLSTTRNNPINQQRLEARLGADLALLISGRLQASEIAKTGGPERLLRFAPQVAGSMPGATDIVLWSDLIANDNGCFDGGDAEATEENGQAIARRCNDDGALSLKDSTLAILGAGTTSRASQYQKFALAIQAEICARYLKCT